MKKIKRRSDCPISNTLDVLGDKWTLLIIRDLFFEGKRSYGDFMAADEGVASNILADRLELMEQQGLVTKEVSADHKSKFIYTPTEKALDLLPLLVEMMLWGGKYYEGTVTKPAKLLKELKKDKAGTLERLLRDYRKVL